MVANRNKDQRRIKKRVKAPKKHSGKGKKYSWLICGSGETEAKRREKKAQRNTRTQGGDWRNRGRRGEWVDLLSSSPRALHNGGSFSPKAPGAVCRASASPSPRGTSSPTTPDPKESHAKPRWHLGLRRRQPYFHSVLWNIQRPLHYSLCSLESVRAIHFFATLFHATFCMFVSFFFHMFIHLASVTILMHRHIFSCISPI